jgi:hypothetical protein
MKTVTIHVYRIYGTRDEYQGDLLYRGKLIASFDRRHVLNWESIKQGLIDRCKAYAELAHFTHYKIEVSE